MVVSVCCEANRYMFERADGGGCDRCRVEHATWNVLVFACVLDGYSG